MHGERRCNCALAQVCCYRNSTDDRFTPISGLYLKLIGSPENCHVRTHAVQQRASSFDEFVGQLLEMQRHIETERLGGLEVDHQFVLDGGYGLPCAPEVRGHAHAVGEITPLCLRGLRLSRLTYQALSQFGRLRRSTNGFGGSSWEAVTR